MDLSTLAQDDPIGVLLSSDGTNVVVSFAAPGTLTISLAAAAGTAPPVYVNGEDGQKTQVPAGQSSYPMSVNDSLTFAAAQEPNDAFKLAWVYVLDALPSHGEAA